MSQLLLDLRLPPPTGFADFITGANEELIARLKTLADPFVCNAVTLWGPSGCGKSHLLAATASEAAPHRPVRLLTAASVGEGIDAPEGALIVIDDLQHLDAVAQLTLFRLFNGARSMLHSLLLATRLPPRALAVREDLRTRIGQTLIYEVRPLSEADTCAALAHHAAARGMVLSDELLTYLLTRVQRDLPTLLALLDRLDCASRAAKRPPTLPLLREVLQTASVPARAPAAAGNAT